MVGVESSSTDDAEDVVLAHDQVRLVVDLDFRAAVFRNENLVSFLHGEIDLLAVVVDFTGPKSDDFALLRFFLRGIGNNDPPFFTSCSSIGCTITRSPSGFTLTAAI